MVAMRGAPIEVPYAESKTARPPLGGESAAGLELACLLSSPVYLGVGVPRGDGRTVLVLPGFLGNDEYLRPLRGWLQRVGYEPRASGIVFNFGTPSSLIAQLLRRAEFVAGGERLTLIGHSLGGIFARAVAVMRPDLVSHVITLGSPLQGNPRAASHPLVASLGNLLLTERGGMRANDALEAALLDVALPQDVRISCFYSQSDAVVDWRACIDRDPRAQGIEVHGTHCGLVWNREVYQKLAILLASTPRG
ncbi:MAG TPA: alpha/beta fold hydrolase [Dehalococcoidia bacterium]|nr:alpha/beta fold hydrolase [Dehalococcoidia bacterium]